MLPDVHISDSPEAAALAVAERMYAAAKEKTKRSLPFNVAISGGNTPKLLFNLLATRYDDSFPWHFVRLFWVDERCVPPVHPESNFGMTYETLLKHVPIPDQNIFRMIGESDPQKEAKRYGDLLLNQLPVKKSLPLFDFILLGMGDDGHTASIFPNQLELLDASEPVAVATHPVSGQKRITLTGQVINAAGQVAFLITGSSKATVLNQILRREPGFEKYPTSYIHSANGSACFFIDKEAGNK
jgi:6-phosphogluconolactonase